MFSRKTPILILLLAFFNKSVHTAPTTYPDLDSSLSFISSKQALVAQGSQSTFKCLLEVQLQNVPEYNQQGFISLKIAQIYAFTSSPAIRITELSRSANSLSFDLDNKTLSVELELSVVSFKFGLSKMYFSAELELKSEGNTVSITSSPCPGFLYTIYSFMPLFPIVILLVTAFVSKNVVLGSITGIYFALIIRNRFNAASAFFQSFSEVLPHRMGNTDTAKVILFIWFANGFITLLMKNRMFDGLSEVVSKVCNTPAKFYSVALCLCLAIFFDDYSTILVGGNLMRPIAQQTGYSLYNLSFLVQILSGTMAILIPMSAYTGLLVTETSVAISTSNGTFSFILESMKYQFYSVFMIASCIIEVVLQRDFGPMQVFKANAIFSRNSAKAKGSDAPQEEELSKGQETGTEMVGKVKKDVPNWKLTVLLVGIFTVSILSSLVVSGFLELLPDEPATVENVFKRINSYDALLWASATSIAVTMVVLRAVNITTLHNAYDQLIEGFQDVLGCTLLLIFTGGFSNVAEEIQSSVIFSSMTKGGLGGEILLPLVIFLISSMISFALGSSWGTVSLMAGIARGIMIGKSDVIKAKVLGAIFSGAIFGDSLSLFSDTTVLTAASCHVDLLNHFKAQLPYGLIGFAVSLVCGYFLCGVGVPFYVCWIIGIIVILGVFMAFGKKQKKKSNCFERSLFEKYVLKRKSNLRTKK